jgi:endonuclease I
LGQIPSGYYNAAVGKQGHQLHEALANIISGHTVISYDQVWTSYGTTDIKEDNIIWDIYSDNPSDTAAYIYVFQIDQCGIGGTSHEGICYTREHSFCQSWFGSTHEAPYTDLFHLYPTDGYINSRRNNNPYGFVNSPSRIFTNGSKLGPNNTDNAPSGTAYEPIDEFKGDIARSFFYMATRYLFEDANFSATHPMTLKSQLRPWALDMMLMWHIMDPVSEKEIARNEAIYAIQHNRNPFIDYPDLVGHIWGNDSIFSFSLIDTMHIIKPYITSLSIPNEMQLKISFSMSLQSNSVAPLQNYHIDGGNHVIAAQLDQDTILLNLERALIEGKRYHLIVKNIQGENLHFMKDTSLIFTYGFPTDRVVLCAWTFDSLSSKPNVPTQIPSNFYLNEHIGTLYMNGDYGSSNFNVNTQLDAYDGTILGDPRPLTPFKGRSLALQSYSANGQAIVFHFSTSGYQKIMLTLACRKTATGFNHHIWEWSTDGEIYEQIELAQTVPVETGEFKLKNIDFKDLEQLGDQEHVFLKMIVDSASGNTGNNRFDNIVVHGNLISSYVKQPIPLKYLVLVYPNPAHEHITIELSDLKWNGENAVFMLYDIQGRMVLSSSIKDKKQISLVGIKAGFYFYTVKIGNWRMPGKIVIVE